MSLFHCSCGFAIDDAAELGDHLREVFGPDDGMGTDGRFHDELADEPARVLDHGDSCGPGGREDAPAGRHGP